MWLASVPPKRKLNWRGMELTRSAFHVLSFRPHPVLGGKASSGVFYYLWKLRLWWSGWLLSRWWGACSRGPSCSQVRSHLCHSRVQSPPLQLKFKGIYPFLTTSSKPCYIKKIIKRVYFKLHKKKINDPALNTHPLTNYKLFGIQSKKERSDRSWWDKNLVSQSWKIHYKVSVV